MMAGRKKIFQGIFIVLLLGICMISCVKALILEFNIDEQYAISLGYRMANGDKMFLDMWEPHQTSGFVCAIFTKLFLLLAGGVEGLVVFLRLIGIILQIVVSIFLFFTLKKSYSKEMSFYCALSVFALLPKGIQVAEFSNLFIWSMVCTMACLWNLYMGSKKVRTYSILAGVFTCVSILCYPSFLIVVPFYVIAIFKLLGDDAKRTMIYFMGTCIVMGMAYIGYFLLHMSVSEFFFGIKQMMTDGAHDVDVMERCLFYLEELGLIVLPSLVCVAIAYVIVKIFVKNAFLEKRKGFIMVICIALLLSIVYQLVVWLNPSDGVYMHTPLSFYFIAYGMGFFCLKNEKALKWIYFIPAGVGFFAALLLTNTGIRVTGSYLLPGILAVFCALSSVKTDEKIFTYINKGVAVAFLLLVLFQRTYLVCETGGYKEDIFYVKQKALSGSAENVYCRWLDGTKYNEAAKVFDEYVEEDIAVLCVSYNSLWYLFKDCTISNFSTISTPTFDERLFEYWDIHPDKYPKIVIVDKEFFDTNEIEALLNVDNSVYCSEMIAVYEIEN